MGVVSRESSINGRCRLRRACNPSHLWDMCALVGQVVPRTQLHVLYSTFTLPQSRIIIRSFLLGRGEPSINDVLLPRHTVICGM